MLLTDFLEICDNAEPIKIHFENSEYYTDKSEKLKIEGELFDRPLSFYTVKKYYSWYVTRDSFTVLFLGRAVEE